MQRSYNLADNPPRFSLTNRQPPTANRFTPPRYRGRFAPSPTGPLHFGSLVAAVGSYLCARRAGGDWLVRIEDLDPPREMPGSADQIVATLDAFGFEWTESILRQSSRREAYDAAVEQLLARGLAFPCSCTRAELQAAQPRTASSRDSAVADELHYAGWCRNGPRAPERPTAIRMRIPPGETVFDDAIQGTVRVDVSAEVGDFVIRRRDQLHAYQIAVVVDDAYQRITDVVRGADLLHSTARQMILQRDLGLPAFMYAHLPVASDVNGIKLSKSAGAAAIDVSHPARELWRALRFLRQAPPPDLCRAGLATVWEWALQSWHLQPLFGLRQAAIEACG